MCRTRKLLAIGLSASLALAACGGDDSKDSQKPATGAAATTSPSGAQTTNGSTTSTDGSTTSTDGSTTSADGSTTSAGGSEKAPKPADPNAEVIPITARPSSLTAGGLKVQVKVNRLVDPVKPDVDEAQPGNRLLGVYITSQATGNYEPAKVATIASLITRDGRSYPVRVMSGGECEGSFFPAAFLVKSKKPRDGCVGFEIPKKAEPETIILGVRSTTNGKGESARWRLPEPS